MKYLSTRGFEDVTAALNFETADCYVVGGCDLYTTKATALDKKLYREIEHWLEGQHEDMLRISASLSPAQAESMADELNLSRSSPFGPLSQISSRRTFAYLIATLNASHPDYDFSIVLRPTNFRREPNYRMIMNEIDTTIYNLRPRPLPPSAITPPSGQTQGGVGAQIWGPRMWRIIDEEMDLSRCGVYSYVPEEDPFEGDEGAIWSHHYFFFNKSLKRVCYIYLRGLSFLSHSPPAGPVSAKRTHSARASADHSDSGARKRTKYWLGDHLSGYPIQRVGSWDDSDDYVIRDPGDDEVDADDEGPYCIGDVSESDGECISKEQDKSAVRAMSEQLMGAMEV